MFGEESPGATGGGGSEDVQSQSAFSAEGLMTSKVKSIHYLRLFGRGGAGAGAEAGAEADPGLLKAGRDLSESAW